MQDNKFIELLNRVIDKLGDLTPVHQLIAGEMDDAVQRNFRKEQAGEAGAKWKSLAKSTLRSRKTRGAKILQRRGAGGGLLGSITTNYNSSYAEIGTNLVYARIHQFGGTIEQASRSETFRRNRFKKGAKKGRFKKGTTPGRGTTYKARVINIPARPYIIFTPANHKIIINALAKLLSPQ